MPCLYVYSTLQINTTGNIILQLPKKPRGTIIMITEDDLTQEIKQLDPAVLELALNLLKQLPHKPEQTLNKGQKAYQLMLESGFIGSVALETDLSENYKDYLDWSHKI